MYVYIYVKTFNFSFRSVRLFCVTMPLSLDIDENFDDLIDFETDETSTIKAHRNESINSTIHNDSVDTLSTLLDENALDIGSAKGNITDGSGFDLG